jgi:hypothetical protein
MKLGVLVFCFVFVVLAGTDAVGFPPSNADPAQAQWYESLTVPHSQRSCCSVSDCRPVNARLRGDHWQAFIGKQAFGQSAPDAWVDVPPAHVLDHEPNPTGSAVACWFSGEILCFVRPAEV